MATAADIGADDTIQASEYSLYKGLDKIFEDTQMLSTTGGIKNRLGLMVIELDQSLRAFEAGDKNAALLHHERMLGYSTAVMRETDTLTGRSAQAKAEGALNVAPDVRVMLATLLTTQQIVEGKDPLDPETKPWAKTLDAISEAYKQQRAEQVAHITLAPAGAMLTERAAARREASEPNVIIMAGDIMPSRFAQGEFSTPRETIWTRREYKNLATVLEGVRKQARDSNTRVGATVALACLKSINNREIDMLARQRGRRAVEDAEAAKDVKEYAGRLKEYIGKIKKSDTLGDGIKANLDRFAPPAQTAAEGLGRVLGKGSSLLARAFRFAVAVGKRVFGPDTPDHAQKALPGQKPQDPHGAA